MKIILSRKGFDSSYGGGASPILPNGDLLSIPIPAAENEKGIPYDQLNYKGKSYADLMKELGLKLPPHGCCHLDPDLIPETYPRKKGWTGIFGQQGAAMTHLINQEVEVGDLFLFFGSFKRTYEDENGLHFERDYERHIIFGYLKVGAILSPDDVVDHRLFEEHPHFQNRALFHPRNLVYVAEKEENFGTFKYRDDLVLTKSGFPKSLWQLPLFFHPNQGTTISRHSEKDFGLRGDHLLFRSRGIGQDFVVRGGEKVEKWANRLLK